MMDVMDMSYAGLYTKGNEQRREKRKLLQEKVHKRIKATSRETNKRTWIMYRHNILEIEKQVVNQVLSIEDGKHDFFINVMLRKGIWIGSNSLLSLWNIKIVSLHWHVYIQCIF